MSITDTKIGKLKVTYPVTRVELALFRNNWTRKDDFYFDYFHFSLLRKWNLI